MKSLKITTIIHHTSAYLPPPPPLFHPRFPPPLLLTSYPLSPFPLLLPPPRCSTMVSSNSPQVRTGSMPRCPCPLPSQASEGHLPPWRPTPSGSRLPGTTHKTLLSLTRGSDHWHLHQGCVVQLLCSAMSMIRPLKMDHLDLDHWTFGGYLPRPLQWRWKPQR